MQGVTISYAGTPMRLTTAPVSSLRGFLPASVQYVSTGGTQIEGHSAAYAAQLRANGSVTSVYCASTTSTRSLPRT